MITCSCLGRGRLGNQMFQYAFLRGVAARNGFTIGIPDKRNVRLWTFPIKTEKLDRKREHRHLYREKHFRYTPEVFDQPDDTDFIGFFQTEKYFTHIAPEIRNTFVFSPIILNELRCFESFRNSGSLVSIHVRRQDYVQNTAHADLYRNYYENAMSMFSECVFVIVSDDLTWCRQRFKGSNIRYFCGSSIYVDLAAIAACDHHIIANSTFSWWGAWLNPSLNKCVVRPSQWWGPRTEHLEEGDICPHSWKVAAI